MMTNRDTINAQSNIVDKLADICTHMFIDRNEAHFFDGDEYIGYLDGSNRDMASGKLVLYPHQHNWECLGHHDGYAVCVNLHYVPSGIRHITK